MHIFKYIEWDCSDADLIVYSDASLTGLGFTVPMQCLGFCASTPSDCPSLTIFYYEALAIASTILWVSSLSPRVKKILVYTDSLNCVEMFNMLSPQEGYNDIPLFTVRILISSNISLYVFHIPGHDNTIVDALSCHLPAAAIALLPRLRVHHFQPPHVMLGFQE